MRCGQKRLSKDYDKDSDGVLHCNPLTLIQCSVVLVTSSPCISSLLFIVWTCVGHFLRLQPVDEHKNWVRSLTVAAWTFLPNDRPQPDSFKCCVHVCVCVCVIFQGCVCSGACVCVCLLSIYFYIFHLLVPVVYCNSVCVRFVYVSHRHNSLPISSLFKNHLNSRSTYWHLDAFNYISWSSSAI